MEIDERHCAIGGIYHDSGIGGGVDGQSGRAAPTAIVEFAAVGMPETGETARLMAASGDVPAATPAFWTTSDTKPAAAKSELERTALN